MKPNFLPFERDLMSLNLTHVDARDVADLDEDFAELLTKAKAELKGPTLIESSARHLLRSSQNRFTIVRCGSSGLAVSMRTSWRPFVTSSRRFGRKARQICGRGV